jgi:hypothetical protein
VAASRRYNVAAFPRFNVAASPRYNVAAFPRYNVAAFPRFNVAASPRYNVAASRRYNVAAFPRFNVAAFRRYNVAAFPRYNVAASRRYNAFASLDDFKIALGAAGGAISFLDGVGHGLRDRLSWLVSGRAQLPLNRRARETPLLAESPAGDAARARQLRHRARLHLEKLSRAGQGKNFVHGLGCSLFQFF